MLINDLKQAAKNTVGFVYHTGEAVVVGAVDCVLHPINCAVGVKDGFIENANAIGAGAASIRQNDLERLYGQDTRTAQKLILAGNLTEAGLTAWGAGKASGAAVKAGGKVAKTADKVADTAADVARAERKVEINAGLDGEMVWQPEPIIGQGSVATRINVRKGDGSTGSGLNYALRKHGGNGTANKSQFSISENEIVSILKDKATITTPAYRETRTGNYIRNVDTGRIIGNERPHGTPTSTMTVITDKKGNLVNVYPGKTIVE